MSGNQQEFNLDQEQAAMPPKRVKRLGVYHVELVRDRSIKLEEGSALNTVESVTKILAAELSGADREKLICLWLNCRSGLIGLEIVSVGTLTASLAGVREIFKGAILQNAASIVIGHNHPSGDPSPSEEDRRLTKRLAEAGRLLGIELLDHIIVAEKGSFSFKSAGSL